MDAPADSGSACGFNPQSSFRQGELIATGSAADLAIDGPGFFAVAQGQQRRYARGGHFVFDADGILADGQGRHLQGQSTSQVWSTGYGALEDLSAALPARATQTVDVEGNLSAQVPVRAGGFDPLDPVVSSDASFAVGLYDASGVGHRVVVYFRRVDTRTWRWFALVDGAEVSPSRGAVVVAAAPTAAGTGFVAASGALSFSPCGSVEATSSGDSVWDFTGAAPGQAITWNFLGGATSNGCDHPAGMTQFSAPSFTTAARQDGYPAGRAVDAQIDPAGILGVSFDNGQRRTAGYIPLVVFPRANALASDGLDAYAQTALSGAPLPAAPGVGCRGTLAQGFREAPVQP